MIVPILGPLPRYMVYARTGYPCLHRNSPATPQLIRNYVELETLRFGDDPNLRPPEPGCAGPIDRYSNLSALTGSCFETLRAGI